MPLYEFRCLKCQDLFELLVMKTDEQIELRCPKCSSPEFEKVMSSTNYAMKGGAGPVQSPSAQTRNCSGGSCTTYDIPGYI
ncbi:MAG: zinc ribbon domain-containing protein [Deltaproteobacteria bacterium]|nr:zinc ribbon domain-containing protein [Deltaproteobacteria bacterium]